MVMFEKSSRDNLRKFALHSAADNAGTYPNVERTPTPTALTRFHHAQFHREHLADLPAEKPIFTVATDGAKDTISEVALVSKNPKRYPLVQIDGSPGPLSNTEQNPHSPKGKLSTKEYAQLSKKVAKALRAQGFDVPGRLWGPTIWQTLAQKANAPSPVSESTESRPQNLPPYSSKTRVKPWLEDKMGVRVHDVDWLPDDLMETIMQVLASDQHPAIDGRSRVRMR